MMGSSRHDIQDVCQQMAKGLPRWPPCQQWKAVWTADSDFAAGMSQTRRELMQMCMGVGRRHCLQHQHLVTTFPATQLTILKQTICFDVHRQEKLIEAEAQCGLPTTILVLLCCIVERG